MALGIPRGMPNLPCNSLQMIERLVIRSTLLSVLHQPFVHVLAIGMASLIQTETSIALAAATGYLVVRVSNYACLQPQITVCLVRAQTSNLNYYRF